MGAGWLLGMAFTLTLVNLYGVKINGMVSQASSHAFSQVNNVTKNISIEIEAY